MSICAHHRLVRSLPCVVTRSSEVTLHHVHGGSLTEEFPHLARGKSQKTSDWLVIPLRADLHYGDHGMDGSMSVREWEDRFGRQTDHLRWVSDQVGYDVFAKAEE